MKIPVKGNFKISQDFGNDLVINGKHVYQEMAGKYKGHNGIDYVPKDDDNVYAPHDGVIIKADYDEGGYGNYIRLENSKEGSVLAHMDSLVAQVGFTVKCGDKLGVIGSTGFSTGKHLHHGYYRIPRKLDNGYGGYIDPSSYYTGLLSDPEIKSTYTPKYPVGYELKPLLDVEVGAEPGKQNFNYGRVSVKAPAKITEIKVVDGVAYYNIDQSYIGGGSGWVVCSQIDDIEMWPIKNSSENTMKNEPTSPEALGSMENGVEPSISIEEQLKKMTDDRDRLLTDNSLQCDKITELDNLVKGFRAIGFQTPEEVNKFITSLNDENTGLKTQLTQVLNRNSQLAKMVEEKETEDATAIDAGVKATIELAELKKDLVSVAKKTGTKPSPLDILQHIQAISDSTREAIRLAKEEYQKAIAKSNKPQTAQEVNNSARFGVSWLMSFLGLKEK